MKNTLMKSSVLCGVEDSVGRVNLQSIDCAPQVAIRFPDAPTRDPTPLRGQHIDGLATAHNGLKGDDVHSFTALVGVALTDQADEFTGNLTVWPGSHVRCCAAFGRQWKEQEVLGVPEEHRKLGPGHGAGWTEGMFPDAISGIEPRQLRLRAGDAIVAHYQLVHAVAANCGSDVRINLYWRARHVGHHNHRSLFDLWSGFDGMH